MPVSETNANKRKKYLLFYNYQSNQNVIFCLVTLTEYRNNVVKPPNIYLYIKIRAIKSSAPKRLKRTRTTCWYIFYVLTHGLTDSSSSFTLER